MSHEIRTIIVADTSGSMREHGKAALVWNILGHVRQIAYGKTEQESSDDPILVQWSDETTILSFSAQADLPLLPVGKRAAFPPLLALLDSFAAEGKWIRVLIVSDGHFAAEEIAAFRAWARQRQNIKVRSIAVGPDAAMATLARLTGVTDVAVRKGEKVCFRPEDICAALDSWPHAHPIELPTSTAEVIGVQGASHNEPSSE